MAAHDHLIKLLASAAQLDELVAAPRAWAIIEPHVNLLRWPKLRPPASVDHNTNTAQELALVSAMQLGKGGRSLSRINVYECLLGNVPQELAKAVIDAMDRPRLTNSEPAATTALREALTFACERSVASMMASTTYEVGVGSVPVSSAIEQLAKLTASIPGQQINLPPPEGPAYRASFVRAAKRRLICTGFTGIDDAIAGIAPGDYVGLAARSNIGKTAFLLALARAQIFPDAGRNWLVDGSSMEARLVPQSDKSTATDVLLLSLEMTSQGVRERLLLDMLNVDGTAWRRNPDEALGASELANNVGLDNYLDAFHSAAASLTIVDALALGGRATAEAVDSAISTWASQRRAANPEANLLVLVDYWQRVEPLNGDERSTKQQQLGDVSKVLARAAKRENVALVCAAQIGRAADNHEPNESELRESGDLLIDADLVMLLHAASPAQRAKLKLVDQSADKPIDSSADILASSKDENTHAGVFKFAPKTKPSKYKIAHNTMLVIGGKGRDVQAGWKVPLYFARNHQRLVDGWPLKDGGWLDPFTDKEIMAALK